MNSLDTAPSPALRWAGILTLAIIPLMAVASAGGLFLPGLYRDNAWLVAQIQGEDLMALVIVLPALAAALLGARRGSIRATLVGLGILGYIFYRYTGAAFAYVFNPFFLIYVMLFSLAVFTLVLAAGTLNRDRIKAAFDAQTPRGPVAIFLVLLSVMLTMAYLSQILPFLVTGEVPEAVARSENGILFVYTLDLGLVVPLSLLSAVWLWRRQPWGYLLSGLLLVKAATMGLALLFMTWFVSRAGLPVDESLTPVWVLIAAGGLVMSVWFFRHCRH